MPSPAFEAALADNIKRKKARKKVHLDDDIKAFATLVQEARECYHGWIHSVHFDQTPGAIPDRLDDVYEALTRIVIGKKVMQAIL